MVGARSLPLPPGRPLLGEGTGPLQSVLGGEHSFDVRPLPCPEFVLRLGEAADEHLLGAPDEAQLAARRNSAAREPRSAGGSCRGSGPFPLVTSWTAATASAG